MNRVQLSTEYFPNPVASKALSNANIYVGNPDTDPEVVANRKPISALQENGTIVSIAQPVKTGLGGIPVYNGSPITILVDGQYSIKVTSSSGAQLYYVPVNYKTDESPVTPVSDITSLRATLSQTGDGEIVYLSGHTSISDGGQGHFYWDADSVLADDNGTVVQVTGVAVGRWIRQTNGFVTPEMFGAAPLTAASQSYDHSEAIQALMNCAVGKKVFGPGHWMVDAETIRSGNLKEGIAIRSNTEIVMSPDTYIHALDTDYVQTNTFYFYRENNLKWTGGNLVGDIDARTVFGPNYNAIGLRIQGSNDVTVRDVIFTKHYTDGYAVVYNVDGVNDAECERIYFYNCSATDNYRNGASIIGCKVGGIYGGTYSGNSGTIPESGIDVEPNATKTNGQPAVVEDFSIIGVVANDNDRIGIAADAAGTINRLSIIGCQANDNGIAGINTNKITNSTITGNTSTGNVYDLLNWAAVNTRIENNTTTTESASLTEVINTKTRPQGVRMVASGLYPGPLVLDNDNIDLADTSFTITWRGAFPDWTPASETYIYSKYAGASPNTIGALLGVTTLGNLRLYLYRNDAGTIYTTTYKLPVVDNEIHEITIVVVRESVGVAGSISVYVDGAKYGPDIAITAAAPVSLSNTGNMVISGLPTSHKDIDTYGFAIFNRALSSAQVMSYYRYGLSTSDKWGSQSPAVSGCIAYYGEEGIQNVPGMWLDSSTNRNHAVFPVATVSLVKSSDTFEIMGKTSWAADATATHIIGINQAILPTNFCIDSIVGAISGVNVQDVTLGDGADADRFVTITTGLAAGQKLFTIANNFGDGTNSKLIVTPDAPCTMSISWTIRGHIYEP